MFLRKSFTKKTLIAVLAVLFLATSLFVSCSNPTGSDTGFQAPAELTGTWAADGSTDSYTIGSTRLSYVGWDGVGGYSGTIKHISQFTNNSGVIIIQYDKGHENSYPIYDESWNPTGEYFPLHGDFIGIYYEDLTSTSVNIGTAYDLSSAGVDSGPEQVSLNAAIDTFTEANMGTYFSMRTHYDKQP